MNRILQLLIVDTVLMLLPFVSTAQHFSFKTSEYAVIGAAMNLVSTVPVNNGSISLVKETKGDIFKLDTNMKLVKEVNILNEEKKVDMFGLVKSNAKLFLVYTTKSKSVFSLNTKEIDENTLAVKNDKRTLTEFDEFDKDDYLGFRTLRSADSSKFIFYCDHREGGGFNGHGVGVTPQRIQYAVLDKDMNRLYKKEYKFPIPPGAMTIRDFFVSNDGSMYILYFFYPERNSSKTINKSGTVAYEVRLLKLSENEEREINIDINGRFIETITAFQQPNGMIDIVGFYKTDFKEGVAGSYRAMLSAGDKTATIKTYPFPPQFIGKIPANAYFEEARSEIDLKYRSTKIISTDKQVFMFDQYLHTPNFSVGKTINDVYDDVILTSFKEDADVNYVILDMPKGVGTILNFPTSGAQLYKQHLWFFYSDNKGDTEIGGKKQKGLYLVNLDLNGNVLDKKIVKEYNVDDDFKINDRGIIRFGNDIFTTTYGNGARTKQTVCKFEITD